MARYRLPAEPALPRGVTVIEMMVVVAVLAIILALAVPSMRDFHGAPAGQGHQCRTGDRPAVRARRGRDARPRRIGHIPERRPRRAAADDLLHDPHADFTWPWIATAENRWVPPARTSPGWSRSRRCRCCAQLRSRLQAAAAPANQLSFSRNRGLSGWQGHARPRRTMRQTGSTSRSQSRARSAASCAPSTNIDWPAAGVLTRRIDHRRTAMPIDRPPLPAWPRRPGAACRWSR